MENIRGGSKQMLICLGVQNARFWHALPCHVGIKECSWGAAVSLDLEGGLLILENSLVSDCARVL